jgi:hypothetical protein
MPWFIRMENPGIGSPDSTVSMVTYIAITDEFSERYITIDEETGETNNHLEQNIVFEFYQDNPDKKTLNIESGKATTLSINAAGCYGDDSGTDIFRVVVFGDHKPLKVFGENSYLEIRVEKGMIATVQIEIPWDDIKSLSHLYIVAMTMPSQTSEQRIPSVIKSESLIVFENK